jgi:hypothetical protein
MASANATPTNVPIIISGAGGVASLTCTFDGPLFSGMALATFTPTSQATVVYGLSGQNATQFTMSGGNVLRVGSASLAVGNYSVSVQSIPAVDFNAVCN